MFIDYPQTLFFGKARRIESINYGFSTLVCYIVDETRLPTRKNQTVPIDQKRHGCVCPRSLPLKPLRSTVRALCYELINSNPASISQAPAHTCGVFLATHTFPRLVCTDYFSSTVPVLFVDSWFVSIWNINALYSMLKFASV